MNYLTLEQTIEKIKSELPFEAIVAIDRYDEVRIRSVDGDIELPGGRLTEHSGYYSENDIEEIIRWNSAIEFWPNAEVVDGKVQPIESWCPIMIPFYGEADE